MPHNPIKEMERKSPPPVCFKSMLGCVCVGRCDTGGLPGWVLKVSDVFCSWESRVSLKGQLTTQGSESSQTMFSLTATHRSLETQTSVLLVRKVSFGLPESEDPKLSTEGCLRLEPKDSPDIPQTLLGTVSFHLFFLALLHVHYFSFLKGCC